MKFIDLKVVISEIPNNKLDDLLDHLLEMYLLLGKKARLKYMSDNSSAWSNLRECFVNYSKRKCWFTETYVDEQICAIDHFRPKGRVMGEKYHPGYWWLAFEILNFRLCSDIVNEKHGCWENRNEILGKGTEFPLLVNNNRCFDDKIGLNENGILGNEMPSLLDPCNSEDVKLVSYTDEGKLNLNAYPENSFERNRLELSRRILNLDSGANIIRRSRILRQLEINLLSFNYFCKKISLSKEEFLLISELEKKIIEDIKPEAEFQSSAIKVLLRFRNEFWFPHFKTSLEIDKL